MPLKDKRESSPATSLISEAEFPKVEEILIDLVKPFDKGFGVSLIGFERNTRTGVFVKGLTPGGVGQLDGRLQVGDKLLQVNGCDLSGMVQAQVVNLLRKCHGQVNILISRGNPLPEGLFANQHDTLELPRLARSHHSSPTKDNKQNRKGKEGKEKSKSPSPSSILVKHDQRPVPKPRNKEDIPSSILETTH